MEIPVLPRENPRRGSEVRERIVPYVIAVLGVGLALVVTLVAPPLRDRSPFLLLLASVIATTWYAGLAAGIAAMVLACIAGMLLLVPLIGPAGVSFDAAVRWSAFVASGALILWIGAARQRSEEQSQRRLEEERETHAAAEAANRAKDAFLATLSHELRTPLTPILGWVSLLRSGKLDSVKSRRALETIERNTRVQAQLIEDLLDVSRIVSGKMMVSRTPIDLTSTVDSAIATVRPAAKSKGVLLEGVLDQVGKVAGDFHRLQQAVAKLVANGIKFTPKEGRVVVLLDREGGKGRIRVTDNGRGISPQLLPHLFERFKQTDSTTTRPFGGLGMGLTIVRHVVELHDGTLSAESHGEGRGSTFTILLPLLADAAPETKPTTTPGEEELPTVPGLLEGVKVLIVDDEEDAHDMLATVLEESGARVVAVSSAEEAIRALPWVRPDVLVSDIAMPGEDGYALIRKVRNLEPRLGRPIPAVAVTAYAGEDSRTQAMEAGFQSHLEKPFEPQELVAVIARLTERKRCSQE